MALTAVAAPTCPDPAPTGEEVRRSALAVQAAAGLLEAEELAAVRRALSDQVGCVGDVLEAAEVAEVHKAMALDAFLHGDVGRAAYRLQAARAADPDTGLSGVVRTQQPEFAAWFDGAARTSQVEAEELRPPRGDRVYADGVETSYRNRSLPVILQFANERGQVRWTREIEAGDPLPEDLPTEPESAGRLFRAAMRSLTRSMTFSAGPAVNLGRGERWVDTFAAYDRSAFVVDFPERYENGQALDCDVFTCVYGDQVQYRYAAMPDAMVGLGFWGPTVAVSFGVSERRYAVPRVREYWEVWDDLADAEQRQLVEHGSHTREDQAAWLLGGVVGVKVGWLATRWAPHVAADLELKRLKYNFPDFPYLCEDEGDRASMAFADDNWCAVVGPRQSSMELPPHTSLGAGIAPAVDRLGRLRVVAGIAYIPQPAPSRWGSTCMVGGFHSCDDAMGSEWPLGEQSTFPDPMAPGALDDFSVASPGMRAHVSLQVQPFKRPSEEAEAASD